MNSEDHAPDALRYGLMSRPAPKTLPRPNDSGDFVAETIYREVEGRRRRAHYIGREDDRWMRWGGDERLMRALNPARFRGPSDT